MFGMMKESSKLPIHVKMWMGVMMFTFLAHGFFYDSRLHLMSLGAFVAVLAIFAPLSFAATRNINAIALSHFVVWPVALANGVIQIFLIGSVDLTTFAGLLLLWGYVVFAVSLILDYRIILKEMTIAQKSKYMENPPKAISAISNSDNAVRGAA